MSITLQCILTYLQNKKDIYRICTLPNSFVVDFLPSSRLVTFKMMADLQSPDPRCLKLHTAVCRVARLSDVVGYLDAYDREQTGPSP